MTRTRTGFTNILLPVDFTEYSEKASEYALMLAKRDDAELHVVHVVSVSDDIIPLVSSMEFEKKAAKKAQEELKKFAARKFKGYDKVKTAVLSGVPYREILGAIKSSKCDLVVMGSYGKGGIDRLLVGSTTERILRKSTCPVLVIPPAKR
ncbi:Putative universal stress protein [uncultured bacterium]|nr:Putative universal stress protein [uncultured bacterium]